MHRDQALFRRHFRPIADPADMASITQRDHGEPDLLALFDADPDRLRRHRLSIAEFAVDNRQRRRIDHDLGRLVGNHRTRLLPADIDGDPDHTVTVMTGEVGGCQISRDAPRLVERRVGMSKNIGNEIDQVLDLDGNHVWVFGLCRILRVTGVYRTPSVPAPGL